MAEPAPTVFHNLAGQPSHRRTRRRAKLQKISLPSARELPLFVNRSTRKSSATLCKQRFYVYIIEKQYFSRIASHHETGK
jgi:hypothetical protein